MKKPVKVIIGIVVAIAILIAGLSLFFPEVMDNITSGTFGKAEKYRKSQMTENDIKLRSELTTNDVALRDMIQGLIYFSLFTQDLSNKIDSCTDALVKQGMSAKDAGYQNVMALKDYSTFIHNNNRTLNNTISMLTGFLLKDQSDESADVERNLREFQNYVNNLTSKDSVLELSLRSMDNYMLTNRTLQSRKAELKNLKAIRDQLTIGSVQIASVLQDKDLVGSLCSYILTSQGGFNVVIPAQEQIGAIQNQDALKVIMNQDKLQDLIVHSGVTIGSVDQLQDVISAQQVGNAVKSKDDQLGFDGLQGVLVYSVDNLQFVVCNIADLKNQAGAAGELKLGSAPQLGKIDAVVYFSQEGLNVVASSFSYQNIFQSAELSSILQSSEVNAIFSQDKIGSFSFGSNFVQFVGQLNVII